MINEFFLSIGTVEEWKLSLGFLVGLVVFFRVLKYLIVNKFKAIADITKNDFDDFLISAFSIKTWPTEIIFSIFVSSKFLHLGEGFNSFINYITLITIIIFVANFLQRLVKYFAIKKVLKHEEEDRKTDASVVHVLSNMIQWGIRVIAALLILQNSGIDIGALLAGAGIMGIAIAFALKEVLADLFACFSIYFDKPFEVGDYIVLDNGKSGGVKKIGLRTTRIKTLRGEELVISNRKLTDSFLRNYKKMEKRRVSFEVSVDAKTTAKKLEKGKEIIMKLIEKEEDVEKPKVYLTFFTGNSYVYGIIYFVKTRNYYKYMKARENIILNIRKAFDKEKIKFATDEQKIILKKD
ncbi:MAG: mechanosensitive ion channel family protein [Candidatus Pacebacteria bacterium]|nr:mechanosensitive ion channel family protein [Candidatus Paceibacterota bacterium]